MSRMIMESMINDTAVVFLELPDNRDESGSESEYETETDTCSETDPDYTDDMILVTDNEEENDLNSSIDSLPSPNDHEDSHLPFPISKKMKFVLPKYLKELDKEELEKYNKE